MRSPEGIARTSLADRNELSLPSARTDARDDWLSFCLVICFASWSGSGAFGVSPFVSAFLPVGIIVLLGVSSGRASAVRLSRGVIYFAPILALATLSVLWSSDPLGTVNKVASFAALVAAAAFLTALSNCPGKTLCSALVVYGAIHSIGSIALIYTGIGISPGGVPLGLANDKTLLTNIASLGIISSFWVLLSRKKYWVIYFLALLNFLFGGWVLLIGGGGQAIVAVVLASIIAMVGRRSASLAAFSVIGLGIFAVVLPYLSDLILFVSQITGKDITLSGRLYIWEYARSGILDSPILGHGFYNVGTSLDWQVWQLDTFERFFGMSDFVVPNMHNQWIELTYMLGVPGLLVGFWLIACLPFRRRKFVVQSDEWLLGVMYLAWALSISTFSTNIFLTTGEAFVAIVAVLSILHSSGRGRYDRHG